MSIELCILASGSSGNCSVIRTPAGVVLIDAGIGPRTFAKRIDGTGVLTADIRAIVLTHLDSDHFTLRWMNTIVSRQIPLFCDARRVIELTHAAQGEPEIVEAFKKLIVPFEGRAFSPIDGLRFHPILLAHDRMGSHGFCIDGFGGRIGYATDLGRVPKRLIDCFCELDILAIESNYDPGMQENSDRPWFLKQRITNGSGHLSNAQALEAIRIILDRCESRGQRMPAHVVLLHRSRECNCPDLLRMLFGEDPRIARRLTLAEQLQRTEWLRPAQVAPAAGEQLALRWG